MVIYEETDRQYQMIYDSFWGDIYDEEDQIERLEEFHLSVQPATDNGVCSFLHLFQSIRIKTS